MWDPYHLSSRAVVSAAVYKVMLRGSYISNSLRLQDPLDCCCTRIASSFNAFSFTPSFECIPYIPLNSKPNSISKTRAKAKIKTAKHSYKGVRSSKDNGEWFNINALLMPDSNALHSRDVGVPGPLQPRNLDQVTCSRPHIFR